MSPLLAAVAITVLVVACVIVGAISRSREGRRRGGDSLSFDKRDAGDATFGSRATLVQFSTELCARCPQTRRALADIAANDEGLAHIEIDLTHRPDLSARYRVMQTPTVFLVDDTGSVRWRFNGTPRPAELDGAIAAVSGAQKEQNT